MNLALEIIFCFTRIMKYKGIWFLSVLALRVIFGRKSVLMTLSQPLALSNLSTWDSYSFSKFPDFWVNFGISNQIKVIFGYFEHA